MSLRLDLLIHARLAAQRALVGEVSPAMRAAVVSVGDKTLRLRCYFDGPISDADVDSVQVAETEMIANFDPDYSVEAECIRLDYPNVISDGGEWVYGRREQLGD